jgi:AraC-like DNA-binding protein
MAPETRHGYRLGQGVWWTDVYLLPGWLLEDLRLLWDMEGLVRRLLAHVLFRIPFENGYIHIRTTNGETTEWEREIRAMEEESLRAEPCLATVNGCFLKIMGLLNRAYLRDRPDAPAAPPALWRAAANIESLLRSGAPFEPAQLAQSMGVSQRTLERLFRKTTGLTPVRYYQRRRIDRARRLLADPERSVTGIAYELGFADAAHFSRVFNRHAGCAPSAYRTEQLTARRQAAQAAR